MKTNWSSSRIVATAALVLFCSQLQASQQEATSSETTLRLKDLERMAGGGQTLS